MADALPAWPLLMDEATARRFTSYDRVKFRALVGAGLLPPGREQLPGTGLRWHRAELEACTARLWNLERLVPAANDAQARDTAKAALDGFKPTTRTRR